MNKKTAIDQFKQELSKGKPGVFFEENLLVIINAICEEEDNLESVKSDFVAVIIGLFTFDALKDELDKFLIHLIKRNKGIDTWKTFAQKVERNTGFSKDQTGWSRYISKPPKVKTSAEVIFHLLIMENPSICKKDNKVVDTILRNQKPLRKRRLYIAIILLTVFLIKVLLCERGTQTRTVWKEDFYDTSVPQLNNRSWGIIDFSKYHWNQIRDSCLTLFTQYGEYSSNSIDSTVHNLVYKELGCDCCEVTVKIVDFNPYNRYQQAAVFLLKESLSRKDNFRFSFATMKPDTIFERRVPTYEVHNKRGVQVMLQKNGIAEQFTDELSKQIYDLSDKPISEAGIWLKVKFDKKQFTTYYMVNDSTEGYNKYISSNLHFKPKYIGLACLGNGVKADTFPYSEEHIPAFFDYVVVKECE